jgi:hypothetical protein
LETQPEVEPEQVAAETEPSQPATYADAVAELEAALELIATDPTAGSGRLASALLALNDHAPELAKDRETLARRVDAMLQFARLYLKKNPTLAAATMDEAIRQAHGNPLPAASYGPGLEGLYQTRLAEMDKLGTAELEVNCTIRCRVYVDGHEEPIISGPLHLGSHDVWVEDVRGVHPPLRQELELSIVGETQNLSYGPKPVTPRPPPLAPVARLAPLGFEIGLVTIGVGMLIGGVTTLALTESADPTALAVGGLLMGLGGVSLGVGSVMISVDRRRDVHNESLQVMLGWRAHF